MNDFSSAARGDRTAPPNSRCQRARVEARNMRANEVGGPLFVSRMRKDVFARTILRQGEFSGRITRGRRRRRSGRSSGSGRFQGHGRAPSPARYAGVFRFMAARMTEDGPQDEAQDGMRLLADLGSSRGGVGGPALKSGQPSSLMKFRFALWRVRRSSTQAACAAAVCNPRKRAIMRAASS